MLMKSVFALFALIFCVTANHGPVGYELFRNIERVSELRTGVHTRQFSSFDRGGGNADGGPFDCIKKTAEGHCILAEWLGAGEIDSIWSTRDGGVFAKTGKIVIELDGLTVVNAKFQDVLDGKTGAPFSWPLVGNGDDTSGGGVIKIAMPFKRSMKVTVDTNPNYYHVTYRTFSDATDVKTFDPEDPAPDVLSQMRGFGIRDPKPVNSKALSDDKTITTPSPTQTIFEKTGSGEIKEIRIQIPHLVRSPRNVDDARAFGANGWSKFVATIDRKNSGVRITRRLDSSVLNQIANIHIDDMPAGKWNSTKFTQKESYAEETVQIDPNLTKNKTHITVRQDFVSSGFDFNEFRYDIHCLVNEIWIRTDVLDLGPDHPGEELTHQYEIHNQTFAGKRSFRYAVDSKALKSSDDFLAKSRIRGTFDGKVTVDAPIGEFFGSGLGMFDTRSLWFSIDAIDSMFTMWWPMPFAKEVKIELVFDNNPELEKDIKTHVSYVMDPNIEKSFSSGKIGYFHATHHNEHTAPGVDYIFLNTTGHGIFYGVTHTMRGLIPTGNMADFLEGDERVFVDGQESPHIYGTGTEDFYESGWYFRGATSYVMPLAGNPGHEKNEDDCQYECFGAIRIFSGGVSFELSIVFGIEHGPVDDNEPGIYSSVAYWYGLPQLVLTQTDFVEVIDKQSRDKHKYKAIGEKNYELKSSYEGQKYKIIKTANVTTASGEISFTAAIDPKNNGIRIFRTGDQEISYQCVEVHVDNQLIGRWLQPLGNKFSRFLDDNYDIPLSITKGKTELTIKLVPVSHESGPIIWSASHYRIMSILE